MINFGLYHSFRVAERDFFFVEEKEDRPLAQAVESQQATLRC